MNRLMTETVTLVRRGEPTGDYDLDGKPIFSPDTRHAVPAWYEPRGSSESVVAQEQQNWGFWVYLPGGTDLSAVDSIEIDGVGYRVDGEPGRQPGGFIVDRYVSVAVERTTG